MKKTALLLTFVVLLCSCGKQDHYVENLKLAEGIKYTGNVDANNKPNGKNGKIMYDNGNTFTGDFNHGSTTNGMIVYYSDLSTFVGDVNCTENYVISKVNGVYTYANGETYTGEFVNDLFEDDDGIFDHSHMESGIKVNDIIYQGSFVEGSYINQIGDVTFPAKAKRGEGIWSINGVKMSALKTIKANQNCTYEEYFPAENKLYTGEGYYNGTTATYVANQTYDGKTDFFNGCTYEGQYMNGLYHGQGKFVWDLFDGYSYIEGEFANGSPVGLVCTKYFPCGFTGELGCHCFRGIMGTFESPAANQLGWGKIKYEDNSMYIGDIWFNGDFGSGWIRHGQGTIDGTNGWIFGNWVEGVGEALQAIIASKYIDYIDATFDKEINFMNGDGVFYFRKTDGTPYGYLPGNWNGWVYQGAYQGELPEIREGYTIDLSQFII